MKTFDLEPQHNTPDIDSPHEWLRIAAAAFDPGNINGVTNAAAEARRVARNAKQDMETELLIGMMEPYRRFVQFSCVAPRPLGTPQIQEVTVGNGDAVRVSAPFGGGTRVLTWPGGWERVEDYAFAFNRAEEISLHTSTGPRGTERPSALSRFVDWIYKNLGTFRFSRMREN